MAVSRVGATYTAGTVTTGLTAVLPTHAARDRLVVVVGGKYSGTTIPSAAAGWTRNKSTGNLGTGVVGNDTGLCFWIVYSRDATASGTTNPAITAGATAPDSWGAWAFAYRISTSEVWRDPIANLSTAQDFINDTNTASPLTGTAPTGFTSMVPTTGDAILAVAIVPTDSVTALGTTSITATGLSGGTQSVVSTQTGVAPLGADTGMAWADWTGFTGTNTAAPSASFVLTSSTNHSGGIMVMSLRAGPPRYAGVTVSNAALPRSANW